MKAHSCILAVLVSSAAVTGCSINRAPSLRMLDVRSEYDNPNLGPVEPTLREAGLDGFKNAPVPVRTRPKIAPIWIHPHEMPNHDYFWGGWVSVVVEGDQWVLSKPGQMPEAQGIERMPTPRGNLQKPKSAPVGVSKGAKPKA